MLPAVFDTRSFKKAKGSKAMKRLSILAGAAFLTLWGLTPVVAEEAPSIPPVIGQSEEIQPVLVGECKTSKTKFQTQTLIKIRLTLDTLATRHHIHIHHVHISQKISRHESPSYLNTFHHPLTNHPQHKPNSHCYSYKTLLVFYAFKLC